MHRLQSLFVAAAVALSCLCASAQAKLGFEGESHASVGIYVKDLSTGKIIAENDAYRSLTPASIMKCITAASALTMHGRSYQFSTPTYLYGHADTADESHWIGNLIVESCGDPSIDSEVFDARTSLSREITAGLKRLGITGISGRVIVSETLQQPGWVPQWGIDDVPLPYGAGLFGFNYRDNYYRLWPASGETKPYVPGLKLTVIQEGRKTELSRGIDSENLTVYGPDATNLKWMVKVSMNNPAEIFTRELENSIKAAGITIGNEDCDDESTRRLVCEHTSPDLADILQQMMYESHNLFAEGALRSLAPDGSRDDALKQEKQILQSLGVATRYNTIVDGSGLSRPNSIQPAFMSAILETMAKGNDAQSYVALFPIAGKNGTVKGLMKKTSLEGRLALKSGSMNGVQCFAGYKLGPDSKPTHTVVIMVNNFFCPRGEVRRCIENFLVNTLK